jgi:DNA repair protein RecN (Recombination protein N)
MLHTLKITNVALIEQLTIQFKPNLNVLSGETGAGKSIIIDSLNFLLGARADKTLIRSGQNEAKVVGVFHLDNFNEGVAAFFEKTGIVKEDVLIISRQMNINGKSITQVNGEFVTATMLRALTSYLIDIHGQNEHQFLLNAKNQLSLIDEFMLEEISKAKQNYLVSYGQLKAVNEQIDSFGGSEEERLKQIDLLNFEINEIMAVELSEEEEERLSLELKRMQNIEKIATQLNNALQLLEGARENGLVSSLAQVIHYLNSVSQYDSAIEECANRLESVKLELADVILEVSAQSSNVEFDEKEYEKLDDKLEQIKKLKRKYGGSIASVHAYLEETEKKLNELQNSKERLDELSIKKQQILKDLLEKGTLLHNLRKQSAKQLTDAVLKELIDLGMPNANLNISFLELPNKYELEEKLTKNGLDEVEFLFSANLGEPLKPLSKIISGGEMSRFMLAIKTIAAKSDEIDTMIFDEIDTGVSGKMAQAVSKKLAKISRAHQVIVVSHLPQISAMADTHYYIEKVIEQNKTLTKIRQLQEDEMLEEIARMLSSENVTEASKQNAFELKQEGNYFKKQL